MIDKLEDVFIWTEAYNCGELLTPFLSSYIKHNNLPIHVFGSAFDLNMAKLESPLIKKVGLSNLNFRGRINLENKILEGYKKGHKGTSVLWAYLIQSRKERFLMHIDADTIFLGDVVSFFFRDNQYSEFGLMGSRRPYKYRAYRKSGIDSFLLNRRPDTVNTDCFLFDKDLIPKSSSWLLERKIRGRRTSFFPVVDFFDPISFNILKYGGRIKYIDSPSQDKSGETNYNSDFFNRRINFAAVGSGINFYKNAKVEVPIGYRRFALASWSTYSKYVLGIDLGMELHDDPELISKLQRLDKVNWRLQ